MKLDETTFRDLEIFEASGQSVFSIVDRTTTHGGHIALRNRFRNPSSDPEQIAATQVIVRHFTEHPLPFFPLTEQVNSAQRYLSANIEAVSARAGVAMVIQAWWTRYRYRDVLSELQRGVQATIELLREVRALHEAIEAANPPVEVQALIGAWSHAFEDPRVVALLDTPEWLSATRLLGMDRTLRQDLASTISDILTALFEVDALHAMATATRESRFVFPELVDGMEFLVEAEEVVHPFVSAAVPNRVELGSGGVVLFLTGPNMGGKTTYLKAVAIALYLGHLGMGVPATRMRFTPLDAIHTSMHPEDDLRAGLSFFLAEVRRVKHVAERLATGERAFVVFDEVFKGTNIRDAIEASKQVILGFARCRASGFIFASHLSELAPDLEREPSVRFACFDGTVVDGVARYPYRLEAGVSDRRFGLHLLHQEGIPDLLERLPR